LTAGSVALTVVKARLRFISMALVPISLPLRLMTERNVSAPAST
jgi:hypothetical protein